MPDGDDYAPELDPRCGDDDFRRPDLQEREAAVVRILRAYTRPGSEPEGTFDDDPDNDEIARMILAAIDRGPDRPDPQKREGAVDERVEVLAVLLYERIVHRERGNKSPWPPDAFADSWRDEARHFLAILDRDADSPAEAELARLREGRIGTGGVRTVALADLATQLEQFADNLRGSGDAERAVALAERTADALAKQARAAFPTERTD